MRLPAIALATIFLLPIFAPPVPAQTWQKVQERQYLRIGVKDNTPPLGWRDQQGNWQGLEIDIARELAQELLGDRNAVQFVPLSNRERISALPQLDMVIAQMTVTPNRQRLVDFSLPYYTDSTIVIARRSLTRTDLKGILVLKGSTAIAVLQERFPQVPTIGIDSYQQGITALSQNSHLGLAGDLTILSPWLQQNPDYSQLGGRLSFHPLAIALPKGLDSAELRQRVRQVINKWRSNGWLAQRHRAWGLP
jgi:polar amino acid transport system substrate-binding protein